MSTLTIELVGRSMDYVRRQLELLEWAKRQLEGDEGDLVEFRHVELSAPMLAEFMEGSETFMLFDRDSLNRFVAEHVQAGTWRFIQGLQQYTFAGFTDVEVAGIAEQLAFSIAPNKILTSKGVERGSDSEGDLSQSPMGSTAMENGPDEIITYLYANPWLIPLVALGMSREIPTFEEETNGK